MKKSLFLAAATVAAMTAGAQTYIGQPIPELESIIPGSYTASGTLCLTSERTTDMYDNNVYYRSERHHYRLDTVSIYDKDLRKVKTFSPNLGTFQFVYKSEWKTGDGEWNDDGDSSSYTAQNRPLELYLTNLDGDGFPYGDVAYTQTLFNSDSKYEFLVPAYSGATYTQLDSSQYQEDYWNEATQTWEYRTVWHYYRYTYPDISAINIVADNGTVVGTINAPAGKMFRYSAYSDEWGSLIKLGGRTYLILRTTDEQEAWYRIDGATQSISLVQDAPVVVRPTVVSRGADITVDLGDNPQGRQVEVVDALGRTVKRVAVPAGQREVRIGTADLGRGINLVGSPRQGAAKVIVR